MVSGSDGQEPALASGDIAGQPGLAAGLVIPPLNVSGLVVSKADLIAALRVYVPQLADMAPMDGDRFLLNLTQAPYDGRL